MSLPIHRTLDTWIAQRDSLLRDGRRIGFVPTMGALHAGHLSLVERSRRENDVTLVSVFVNPTQFNDPKDFERYPVRLEQDAEFLRKAGADHVLAPTRELMYPDGFAFRVEESEYSRHLEGEHRPGHFTGMLTVVLKLLQLAQARHAYFGEKDYQQLELIRRMARAFFLTTEIVGCPTLRHEDGLAMSSRNELLSAPARAQAPRFAQLMRSSATAAEVAAALAREGFGVDYVADFHGRRLGAVRLDGVRLIDNFDLKEIYS
jgi:pantoate--beta-alanine ligase